MKYKILSLLAIGIFIGAMFWIVPIFKNRYFQEKEENKTSIQIEQEDSNIINSPDENIPSSVSEDVKTQEENIPEIKIDEVKSDSQKDENVLVSITSEHCNSECKAFESNFEFLEYCQQVCGISPAKEVSASDCEAKKDLARDYCFKDLAIIKKDFSLCEKIKDSNVKKTCKNRITQDIIEGN